MPSTASGYDRQTLGPGTQTPGAGGTVTPDLSQGRPWVIQMPAGNITIANPLNAMPGDLLMMAIIQDSIGARTVTWGSLYKKSAVTLSITANARDSLAWFFDGTNWNQIGGIALALS